MTTPQTDLYRLRATFDHCALNLTVQEFLSHLAKSHPLHALVLVDVLNNAAGNQSVSQIGYGGRRKLSLTAHAS